MAEVGEGRSLRLLGDVESQNVGTDSTHALAITLRLALLQILYIGQSHIESELVRGREIFGEGPVAIMPTQHFPGHVPNQRLPK